MKNFKRIICALDFDDLSQSISFIKTIKYDIIYKIGMEFFYNFGYEGIEKLKKNKSDIKIFLDLKLHDIPNTVGKSLIPLLKNIKPYMITLHISGGKKMLKEATKIVNKVSKDLKFQRPMILGVTILTSLDEEELNRMGQKDSVFEYVLKYAYIAKSSGLDGVVCSPLETELIKKSFGSSLKTVTPGIRLEEDDTNDQARTLTPSEALINGSDYIVMGRSLIGSKNPNRIINKIITTLHE